MTTKKAFKTYQAAQKFADVNLVNEVEFEINYKIITDEWIVTY